MPGARTLESLPWPDTIPGMLVSSQVWLLAPAQAVKMYQKEHKPLSGISTEQKQMSKSEPTHLQIE